MTAFSDDNESTKEPKKSEKESFVFILKRIRDFIDAKGGVYKKDPMYRIPLQDALSQLKIKAIRAQLVTNKDKLMDEITDCIIYGILIAERLNNDERYFSHDDE